MKLCVKCMHHRQVKPGPFSETKHFCYRMVKVIRSPVTGREVMAGPYALCDAERSSLGSCKPEGIYHEV